MLKSSINLCEVYKVYLSILCQRAVQVFKGAKKLSYINLWIDLTERIGDIVWIDELLSHMAISDEKINQEVRRITLIHDMFTFKQRDIAQYT